jgi:hypothetical protein
MSPQFLVADIEHFSLDFYTKKLGFDLEFSLLKISMSRYYQRMATPFFLSPQNLLSKRKKEKYKRVRIDDLGQPSFQ